MMVSSFDYPSLAMPSREETTEQIHMMYLLSTFALCLGIGCLLMFPLAPHYRLVGTHYCAALLPLLFTWWGIIIPVVTYWLFQQYVSTRWEEAHIKRCDIQDLFALASDFQIATNDGALMVKEPRSDIKHRVWQILYHQADMADHRAGDGMQIGEIMQLLIHAERDQQPTFYADP